MKPIDTMENDFHVDSSTKVGTASGTLLTILFNIHVHDILKTIVLAAIGAVVSFSVSLALKYLAKKLKK
ncbi:MAG: hypothetical protein V9E88_13685 [Ferruginibacter sp.]